MQAALKNNEPIVALESTIISHGLPRPTNIEVASDVEAIVRENGATPATIAVIDGAIHVGLEESALQRIATDTNIAKASIRDLPVVIAKKLSAATTVAATSHIAHLAGISIFATGGLGGVHRGAQDTWDESADLHSLANIPVMVVSAGAKSFSMFPQHWNDLRLSLSPLLVTEQIAFLAFISQTLVSILNIVLTHLKKYLPSGAHVITPISLALGWWLQILSSIRWIRICTQKLSPQV